MHLKLTAADKTDVGKQREQNEDCAYKRVESTPDGDRGLFVVADGMGGYKAGEVASRLAVETISKTLDSFFKPITEQPTMKLSPIIVNPEASEDTEKTLLLPPVSGKGNPAPKTRKLSEAAISPVIEDQLTAAIQQANRAILRYGEQQTAARGLGSTVTVVLIQNDQAYIANVGDSRTYLLRNNQLMTLTKDHSLVQKLVESKQIEPEDVYTHPQRNLIYRSLGAGHRSIEVDIFYETIQPGDTLLLCSDGLWEMVRPQELKKTLSEQASPQKICDSLIAMANDSGGEDNITAVVVHVNQN
ncbi:MAG TPA: PP2C family serine/threonine-protein phosphatase [Ktedonobacteraceae bacterium]|jgi:protein phosphatase